MKKTIFSILLVAFIGSTIFSSSGLALKSIEISPWDIALILDSNGNPHLCYTKDGELFYAKWANNDWDVSEIDIGIRISNGLSMDFDSEGNPHLCFSSLGGLHHLKLTEPAENYDTIQETRIDHFEFKIDSNNHLHVGYIDVDNKTVRYAINNASSWDIIAVDTVRDDYVPISMDLDSNGNPYIAYQEIYHYSLDRKLKVAIWQGSSFQISEPGDGGSYVKIVISPDDIPYVLHNDWINKKMKITSMENGNWNDEIIFDDGLPKADFSFDIDKNGNLHLTYYNRQLNSYIYGHNLNGDWQSETIVDGIDEVSRALNTFDIDETSNEIHFIYRDSGTLQYKIIGTSTFDLMFLIIPIAIIIVIIIALISMKRKKRKSQVKKVETGWLDEDND